MAEASDRTFWAFLSYRHADNKEPGRQWATWLQQAIETYEVPADLVGTTNERGDVIPERIFPIFRDEEELPADADLEAPIYRALDRSKLLVVICSPRAAASAYVAAEIIYFKKIGRADRVLGAMIAGEPNASHDPAKAGQDECFPEPLRHPVGPDGELDRSQQVEPIAADFRLPDGSEGSTVPEKAHRARHELAKLKVIAGILGVPLGTLTKRDQAYQLVKARRRARIVSAVAAALGLLAVAAVIAGVIALRKEREAVRARGTAENLIQQIVFDLRNKLEPIGRLDLLDDVSAAAEDYFVAFPADDSDPQAEYNRAVLFNNRGSVLFSKGEIAAAREAFEQALAIFRRRSRAEPENRVLRYDIANTLAKLGGIEGSQGNLDAALAAYNAAAELLDELEASHDGKSEYPFGERLLLQFSLGGTFEATGNLSGAEAAYSKAAEIAYGIIENHPDDQASQRTAADAIARLAAVLRIKGNLTEAAQVYETLLDQLRELSALAPTSALFKGDVAGFLIYVGEVRADQDRGPEATAAFEESLRLLAELKQDDPENTHLDLSMARAHDRLADFHRKAGDLERALPPTEAALEICHRLASGEPEHVGWQLCVAAAESNLAELRSAEGDHEAALSLFEPVLAKARALAADDPGNHEIRSGVATLLSHTGTTQRAAGELDAARTSLREGLGIREQLVELSPENADWRRDLWTSHAELGELEVLAGDTAAAAGHLRQALALMDGATLHALDQRTKAEVEARLARLGSS